MSTKKDDQPGHLSAAAGPHISRTERINQSTLSAAASDDISSGERPRAYLEKVCAARHLSPRCFLFLPSHPDSSLLPSCARQKTRSPRVLPQKGRKSLPHWFAHTIRLTRATATAQDRRGGCRAQVLGGEAPASWLAPVLGLVLIERPCGLGQREPPSISSPSSFLQTAPHFIDHHDPSPSRWWSRAAQQVPHL